MIRRRGQKNWSYSAWRRQAEGSSYCYLRLLNEKAQNQKHSLHRSAERTRGNRCKQDNVKFQLGNSDFGLIRVLDQVLIFLLDNAIS